MNFDDSYVKYVIRYGHYGQYVGCTSEQCLTIRSWAARFTREQAMKFIADPAFDLKGPFVIEDAVSS